MHMDFNELQDLRLENFFKNIQNIQEIMQSTPNPYTIKTDNEFMHYSVELMNGVLYLLRIAPELASNEKMARKGFIKKKAIIVGHMVRIGKLYEGLLIHICQKQFELAIIFLRLIYETEARMEYLMQASNQSFRNFCLITYKPQKEILNDFKNQKQPLKSYQKRIVKKVKARLKRDRISLKSVMSNKQWKLDGKDFRAILKDINRDSEYALAFGAGSHSVHGDWAEISVYHLEKEGRYWLPKIEFTEPDPRLTGAVSKTCLMGLVKYLEWSKSDPDNFISPLVWDLGSLFQTIDDAHEKALGDWES